MLQKDIVINENGDTIPVKYEEIDGLHFVSVNDELWATSENDLYAQVIFNLIANHVTDYLEFKKN